PAMDFLHYSGFCSLQYSGFCFCNFLYFYLTLNIETPVSIEVWSFEESIKYDFKKMKTLKKRRSFEELTGPEKVVSIKRREKYYNDKRQEIKRLVNCNFDKRTSFLTLTQNEESSIRKNIDVGNLEFQKFIKRLKRWLKKNRPGFDLRYIATWERTKRGMIHYHIILFNFPFIPVNELQEVWGQGFIKINHVDHVEKSKKGLYVSKYFAKELEFKDAKKKAYFTSRNLNKPQKFRLDLKEFDIKMFGKPDYENKYKLIRKDGMEFKKSEVKYYAITKKNLE
ncbi:MAG: hypothetical protein PWP20_1641, partial [Eubacteriaceae bacterium]|nr:hypothetical protein [Eubacteriaceae bacterium]